MPDFVSGSWSTLYSPWVGRYLASAYAVARLLVDRIIRTLSIALRLCTLLIKMLALFCNVSVLIQHKTPTDGLRNPNRYQKISWGTNSGSDRIQSAPSRWINPYPWNYLRLLRFRNLTSAWAWGDYSGTTLLFRHPATRFFSKDMDWYFPNRKRMFYHGCGQHNVISGWA